MVYCGLRIFVYRVSYGKSTIVCHRRCKLPRNSDSYFSKRGYGWLAPLVALSLQAVTASIYYLTQPSATELAASEYSLPTINLLSTLQPICTTTGPVERRVGVSFVKVLKHTKVSHRLLWKPAPTVRPTRERVAKKWRPTWGLFGHFGPVLAISGKASSHFSPRLDVPRSEPSFCHFFYAIFCPFWPFSST